MRTAALLSSLLSVGLFLLLFLLLFLRFGAPAFRLVGFDDARDEAVAHDVALVGLDEGNALDVLEDAHGFDEARALACRQVDLRAVARDDHLGVAAHAGEEHLVYFEQPFRARLR